MNAGKPALSTRLEESTWLTSAVVLSDSVLSKTAIFPQKEGRKREISNESARGSSLRETNVEVSAKGAPHDGQDTVKTLRAIIWYKRACIRQRTRPFFLTRPQPQDGVLASCPAQLFMFVRVHFMRAGIQVFMRRCLARGEEIERERGGGEKEIEG